MRYRRELGQEVDFPLANSAIAHLHAAGRRAAARGDVAAAVNLLDRALALASGEDPVRSQVAVELADQMIERGDYARVDELLDIGEHDTHASRWAALIRLQLLLRTQPHGATQAVQSQLPALLDELIEAGDERGLARAHFTAAFAHWLASRAGDTAHELALAADYARKAGDMPLLRAALTLSVGAVVHGPASAVEMAASLDELDSEGLGPAHHAWVEIGRCDLARLEGRLEDARAHLKEGQETLEQLGTVIGDLAWQTLAGIQRDEGDLAGALESYMRCDAGLEKRREQSFRSTTQANMADIALELGDRDAARTAADLSEELGAPEDVVNYAICHRVRARLALGHGDVQEAERWAYSALENALKTDFPDIQARARLELSRVLSQEGRAQQARQEAQSALALYEAKGYRLGASEAKAWLAQL